jgi:sugar lactone lactonase YvrE
MVYDSSNQLYFTDAGPFGETGISNPRGSCFVVSGSGEDRVLRPIALEYLAYPTGLALNPSENIVYVCEQANNRVLRFIQRPTGVFHATVFFQFAGRLGPSSIVCDHSRGGLLYVARPETPDASERGLISILSSEGMLLREFDVPGPEISSLAISPDSKYLYFSESTNNTVCRILL